MSTDADTVTDERVAGIADRMREEGRKVSPVTIWSEIQSGSIVAIAAALQRWREAREPKTPRVHAEAGLPENIAETIMSSATRLWTAAQDEAERVMKQRLDVVNQQLGAAVMERDEALAEYQKTVEELERGRERLIALTNALTASEAAATSVAAELATAAGRAETAEARVEELVQRASVEEARLQHTEATLAEERRSRDELATAVSSKSDEIARLAQERDAAREELATLGDAYQAKSDEVTRWSQESGVASSRADAAEARANESLTRVATLEAEFDEARAAFEAERQTAAAQIDAASNQLDELRHTAEQLDEAREQISVMSAAKTAAIAELTRVSQDASAAGERADAAERHAIELTRRLAELDAALRKMQSAQQTEFRAAESAKADEVGALQRQISAQSEAHTKALSELRTVTEQWVAHAKELKQRLGQASEKILFIDARSTGEVALVRRLSSELERLKPDHELISRDAQQKLIGATMAEQLARKGYRYEPATAVMSKVES